MADSDTGDKTEKASEQKLRKSREQGQVVRSRDLATALGILVSLKVVVFLLPGYLADFRAVFQLCLQPMGDEGTLDNAMSTAFLSAALLLVKLVLPLFLIPLAIVLGSLLPGGWVFHAGAWLPDVQRWSPAANLGRIVSGKHGFEFAASVGKALVLSLVLLHVARSTAAEYIGLQSMPLDDALVHGASMMLDGLMALVAVFVLFAIVDVPAQAFFFARQQRMSKQEVKEEHKSTEGRPEIKQRVRQLQRQIARRGVRKTVPTADVVIVNPEHYAVALKYDESRAAAPFVVAKGLDEMALYIRQVAKEHQVEILPLPPLARAIYHTSQVNQQIPVALYQAVSQVLHYVLQLKAFRIGRRPAAPRFPHEIAVPPHLSEMSSS
jgi:flagellar biosynthetic protein FlhB